MDESTKSVFYRTVRFGRLDIAPNNTGYSLVGMIEESSSDDFRAMYETNIFGLLQYSP